MKPALGAPLETPTWPEQLLLWGRSGHLVLPQSMAPESVSSDAQKLFLGRLYRSTPRFPEDMLYGIFVGIVVSMRRSASQSDLKDSKFAEIENRITQRGSVPPTALTV